MKDGQGASRLWRALLRNVVSIGAVVVMLPLGLAAQTTSSGTMTPGQAGGIGGGPPTPLRFAGESVPENQATLGMGLAASYDDNVLGTASQRIGDEALSFTSRLGVTRRSEKVTIDFLYIPFFQLYRQVNQFDRLNHSATLGASFRLSTRFSLALSDSLSYQNGIYSSIAGDQILSGQASPIALNLLTLPPTVRTLANSSELGLTFTKSPRTSLTFSGGYNLQQFGSRAVEGQPLYNSRGASAGFQYQYRVTEHTSFGLSLLHQDSTYKGGEAFGSNVRTQSESAFISVQSQLARGLTVAVYGGPQYVRTIGQSVGQPQITGHLLGAGGGSLTKEVHRTALSLAAQRSVSSGGGIFAEVIQTSMNLGLRRRLIGKWEVGLQGGAGRVDSSLFQTAAARADTLNGMVDFTYPLRGTSDFRISYEAMHQVTGGALPIMAGFDRSRITISFDYQLKAIPLGR